MRTITVSVPVAIALQIEAMGKDKGFGTLETAASSLLQAAAFEYCLGTDGTEFEKWDG
jgi:hypothetical protein